MIFVQFANYEAIYDFKFVAETTINREYNNEFAKAWELAERTAR